MRLLASFYLLMILAGCGGEPQALGAAKRREAINDARGLVDNLVYMQDRRTGLCFAYVWGGQANGGPALTNVDCKAIPSASLMQTDKSTYNIGQ